MTVVAVGSLKASPGATTTMLALAAVWPVGRPLLLVEADPDGGVLAARFGLSTDPGLATAAPALRRDASAEQLARHVQTLPGGTPLLVAPGSPEQTRVSLSGCATRLGGALAAGDGDALVDCGRLAVGSPALPLLAAADRVVVVIRPRVEELQYLVHRLPALREACREVVVMLVGDTPYKRADVQHALGVDPPEVLRLAADPRAAAILNGTAAGSGRALKASLLLRTARQAADRLAAPPGEPRGWEPQLRREAARR